MTSPGLALSIDSNFVFLPWEFDELLLDFSKSSGLSISPCELIETFSCSSSSEILTSSILSSGDPFD